MLHFNATYNKLVALKGSVGIDASAHAQTPGIAQRPKEKWDSLDRICPVSLASCALLKFIPSYATPNSFSLPIKWPACQLSFCRAVVPVSDTHTQSHSLFLLRVWSVLNNRLSFQSTDFSWLLHSAPLKRNSRKLGKVGRAGRAVKYCFILTSFRTMAEETQKGEVKKVGHLLNHSEKHLLLRGCTLQCSFWQAFLI